LCEFPEKILPRVKAVDCLGFLIINSPWRSNQKYCERFKKCGLELDPHCWLICVSPHSTFVEDTAILTPGCAIITNPGAASRERRRIRDQGMLQRNSTKKYIRSHAP
jgi:N-dimethylarginine dimethylaminohydrolase